MKITMLGTGNALVTKCYNTCFVISNEEGNFLVDAGGGNTILRQLELSGIDYLSIHNIFITHKHVDHIMGAVWMVRAIGQAINAGKYEGICKIYAHDEVIGLIESMSVNLLQKKVSALLGKNILLIKVNDGEKVEICGMETTFFDICSNKARQFGFSLEYAANKKLVCCGDEPYRECERKYAENADWLMHEAFCLYSQADIFHPYEKNHSTVMDACKTATELGVKNLILYHTEDKNIANRKVLYTEEGRPYFSGGLHIPNDLDTIEIL